MKVFKVIGVGLIAAGIWSDGCLASPPLDRPSPPPCCADGHAWASPAVYGVFPTRWRRWPLEAVEELPTGKPAQLPAKLKDEIPPYVPPSVEFEDRTAPPPTTPPSGQALPGTGPGTNPQGPVGAGPGQTVPPAGGPGTQPNATPFPPQGPITFPQTQPQTPPTSPLGQPSGPTDRGAQPENTSPLFRNLPPNSPLKQAIPTGDNDPPPTLPFGPQSIEPSAPIREASQNTTAPAAEPSAPPAQSPSNDPPPAPPASLASLAD